jgi:PKD repeat protein
LIRLVKYESLLMIIVLGMSFLSAAFLVRAGQMCEVDIYANGEGSVSYSFDSYSGTVSPDTIVGFSVSSGTVLTLQANPQTGYVFTGWNGAFSSSQNPISINVTSNLAAPDITANFASNLGVSITPTSATVQQGQSVTFTASASGGSGGYTYVWTWEQMGTTNRGSQSTGSSNQYTFTPSNIGSYEVWVTVTDSSGNTNLSLASSVTVESPALSASASANPTSGNAPLSVQFTGSASGGSSPYSYSWSFGDGGSSSQQNPSHTYSSAGTYTATLTVTDSQSNKATSSVTITVSQTLSAFASASPTSGSAPLTVQFTGSASGGSSPYSYSWSFGDGGSSSQQNPSHTYSSAGTYTATLTVTDSQDHTAVSSPITITVTTTAPPFQFTVSTSGNLFAANLGESIDVPVSVNLVSGTPQQVSLSVAWIPTGSNQWFTTSFSTASGDPSFTSTLTITVLDGTPSGSYTAQILASGGSNVETATVTIAVNPQLIVTGFSTFPTTPTEGQVFTLYVTVKNTGNSETSAPGYLVVQSTDPGTDPQGSSPHLNNIWPSSSNPTTIGPEQTVTLAYSATALWNFARPPTFWDTFDEAFVDWLKSFVLQETMTTLEGYAFSKLSYSVGTGTQTTLTYYLVKEDIESSGADISTLEEFQALASIANMQSNGDIMLSASYALSLPTGQTVGEVGVVAPQNKIDEAMQYVIASIGALGISAACGAAAVETAADAAAASTTGVGVVTWVVPGVLIAASALATPITNAWYHAQISDPSNDYTEYVTLPATPAIFGSLPNNIYSQLLYDEYEYYAYMNASATSSDRAYGALQANASYYVFMQEHYASEYALNASSYFSEIVTELNAVLKQLNSAGCFNYTAFQEGQKILSAGLPENITDILEPLGILPYVNTTSLADTPYQEINSSRPVTLPDTASYYAQDAQLTVMLSLPHKLPILITNTQPEPVPSIFQQLIVINSSAYASYEASHLQNVEFLYANGSVIPSWLESGDSNASTHSVYWLKIDGGIPAHSSITIYIGFASPSINLFNNETTGEAPTLSPTYGEYDDGANVFSFYDNFAGYSLSSQWDVSLGSGSYQVNDGLTINYAGTGYVVSSSLFGPGTVFDASITSIGDVNNVGYFNLQEPLPVQPGGPGYAGAFIRLAGGNTYPDQWNSSSGEANSVGGTYGSLANAEGIPGIYTVGVIGSTSSIQYLNYALGSSLQPLTTNYPRYPASVGFAAPNNLISVQWARVRVLPPNGVMPSFSILTGVIEAITNVTLAKNVVGQGFPLDINVTTANNGGFMETFNVTIYADATEVGTQTITLASGAFGTITFALNTTGFAYGNYTLWANTESVLGETNLANNIFTGGTVKVTIPGDANGDGTVDAQDFYILERAWGTSIGQKNYDPRVDFNNAGSVSAYDFFIMERNWGLSAP